MTQLTEKDYNLSGQHARLWNEMATHMYMFNRKEREIEELKAVTKQEFQQHFETLFFTNRKRIDYELNSEKHKQD